MPSKRAYGGLADGNSDELGGGERVIGQRQQHELLLGERGAHRHRWILGTGASSRWPRAPRCGRRVQISQIDEAARGEEGGACVADRALDAPLLVAARNGHRTRLEAVMGGEGEQCWMEADRFALAFEHGALEVVVQQHLGAAAEGGKRGGVPREEARHAGVEIKAQEDGARVAEHHDEGHQRAARAADLQMTEVRPVDLGLLAGQRAQPQVGLGGTARPQQRHAVAEVAGTAGVAARLHHAEQARRGQRREARQRLDDERRVRIDHRAACVAVGPRHAGLRQHAAHRAVMQAQLPRDRVHAPALDVEVAQDLRLAFRRNRHRASPWALRASGDVAGTPDAGLRHNARRSDNSVTRTPRPPPRRRPLSSSRRVVNHRRAQRRNPDASRSLRAPDSAGRARRA